MPSRTCRHCGEPIEALATRPEVLWRHVGWKLVTCQQTWLLPMSQWTKAEPADA